jgi:protein-tyrosine phosphatase
MPPSLRILSVCTHNRTRSVLMSALLQQHAERAEQRMVFRSAGFSERGGELPTHNAVQLLAERDIDVSGYLSHFLSKQGVIGADLIVTAERRHVVTIAGRWPEVYDRTFTLPEIVELGERVGPRGALTLREWLDAVHAERPSPLDYLDHAVGEIADPTGKSPDRWSTCFAQIDDLSERLIKLLS